MEEDAPTSSSSGSGDVTPTQSSSSSSAVKTNGREGGDGCKEANKKRKAEEEHPEDPERDDGKWMRTDGNKRKAGEESAGLERLRYLKELDKMENKEESGKTQEVVEVAEVEVNEEEEEWTTEEEPQRGDELGDLDPEQVRQGREEEMNYMVKTLKMFEFDRGMMRHQERARCPRQRSGLIGPRRMTVGKCSSDADWWRAISNQSMKDPETTCSRRCHRWKRRRLYSRSLQGCARRDEHKDMMK